MEKSVLNSAPVFDPPSVEQQQLQKHHRVLRCDTCLHSYLMVLERLAPARRVCRAEPPTPIAVQVGNQVQIQLPPIVIDDSFFCHRHRDMQPDSH